jgi:hypothetical protein
MMTDTPQPTSGSEDSKKKRAVGAFPRLSIKKSLELAETIYQLGEGEAVRRLTVFKKLNRSPDSGASRTLITASGGGYGFTTGGYNAEYLGLTERGRKAVSSPDQRSRYQAIYDAMYSNDIFKSFIGKFFQKGFPIDDVALGYLKDELIQPFGAKR